MNSTSKSGSKAAQNSSGTPTSKISTKSIPLDGTSDLATSTLVPNIRSGAGGSGLRGWPRGLRATIRDDHLRPFRRHERDVVQPDLLGSGRRSSQAHPRQHRAKRDLHLHRREGCPDTPPPAASERDPPEIGRASCRERV